MAPCRDYGLVAGGKQQCSNHLSHASVAFLSLFIKWMATATPLALYWIYRGRKYSVLFATLPFEQRTDYTGRPSSPVLPGVVKFGLDTADDTADLADYMFDPHQRAHSHFEAEYEQGSTRRWLDVQAAFLVRYSGHFEPGRVGGWPGEVLHLGLSAAALVKHSLTLEAHSVLPWAAPAEVQRRARLEGLTETQAQAMPAPKELLKVLAPPRAAPPSLTNNKDKGLFGEHVSDAYMRAQGHQKLNDGGVLTPLPPVPARGQGIDGVWKHHSPPPDYIITEAKYGKSRLSMTKDGKQMSDTWIMGSDRLKKAVGRTDELRIMAAMRRIGTVEKRLHTIDQNGKLTETILL
jgi:hypothetical protein